jgi:hypothetical protein
VRGLIVGAPGSGKTVTTAARTSPATPLFRMPEAEAIPNHKLTTAINSPSPSTGFKLPTELPECRDLWMPSGIRGTLKGVKPTEVLETINKPALQAESLIGNTSLVARRGIEAIFPETRSPYASLTKTLFESIAPDVGKIAGLRADTYKVPSLAESFFDRRGVEAIFPETRSPLASLGKTLMDTLAADTGKIAGLRADTYKVPSLAESFFDRRGVEAIFPETRSPLASLGKTLMDTLAADTGKIAGLRADTYKVPSLAESFFDRRGVEAIFPETRSPLALLGEFVASRLEVASIEALSAFAPAPEPEPRATLGPSVEERHWLAKLPSATLLALLACCITTLTMWSHSVEDVTELSIPDSIQSGIGAVASLATFIAAILKARDESK